MQKYKTMIFCLKCKKNTESKNSRVSKTSNKKQCYYQNVLYVVLKNQDLSKNQEANGLLSNLGIKTPLTNSFIRQCFVLNAILLDDLIVIIAIL